jgi:hypothetical protein
MAGLCFNEDFNHFFHSRRDMELDVEKVADFVDTYVDTQVKEFIINVNAMKVGYDSKVWEPIWKDFDPQGGEEQPMFRSLTGEARTVTYRWIYRAWQLCRDGIDPYAVWLEQARSKGLSP